MTMKEINKKIEEIKNSIDELNEMINGFNIENETIKVNTKKVNCSVKNKNCECKKENNNNKKRYYKIKSKVVKNKEDEKNTDNIFVKKILFNDDLTNIINDIYEELLNQSEENKKKETFTYFHKYKVTNSTIEYKLNDEYFEKLIKTDILNKILKERDFVNYLILSYKAHAVYLVKNVNKNFIEFYISCGNYVDVMFSINEFVEYFILPNTDVVNFEEFINELKYIDKN